MKSSETEIAAILGTAMDGGFYAGRVMFEGVLCALIMAPKSEGETKLSWNDLATWAKGLNINGETDWDIPTQDEVEICYRNLKPTPEENSLYARSGINLSAVPPTHPYTAANPAQTLAEAFQAGGTEAFEEEWYWSSTQHAADSDYAWGQYFGYGGQDSYRKSYEGRARAVRRLPI